jgi:hypothetical protein
MLAPFSAESRHIGEKQAAGVGKLAGITHPALMEVLEDVV